MTNGPFDFVKSINKGQVNLIDSGQKTEQDYAPYLTNKSFSYFADTLQYANDMNRFHHLPNKLQYDYYLNIVRPRNRFSQWMCPMGNESLGAVMKYYGYSIEKAQEAILLLSEHEIDMIKKTFYKGGIV